MPLRKMKPVPLRPIRVFWVMPHHRKIQASLLLDKIAMETKKTKVFLDEEIKTEAFTVEKKITPYTGATALSVFSLKALDKNEKLLAERNELIFTQ